ncbi:Hypothetical protein I595_1770 [Croceitalea dokdonensis DOKDO 023]|uniref:Uncharacterized protein n=1 Tax=Croceitalea dokdonensis DOKDO 023 TaxID=1300341 RepID=A0A0P7AZT5_9FLAO|nr:Hypothetical protein I595_1770 [Croceitalea dokdonensis DOKDO 023]
MVVAEPTMVWKRFFKATIMSFDLASNYQQILLFTSVQFTRIDIFF